METYLVCFLTLLSLTSTGCNPANQPKEVVRDVTGSTYAGIGDLPRWANVALAARCAELIALSLDKTWAIESSESRRLVEQAIDTASRSASYSLKQPETRPTFDAITLLVDQHDNDRPESESSERIQALIKIATLAAESALARDRSEANIVAEECVKQSREFALELNDDKLIAMIDQEIDSMALFCETRFVQDYHCVSWQGDHWQVRY